jgi:hypothetical protein
LRLESKAFSAVTLALFLFLLLLAACGRPLAPGEVAFAQMLKGPSFDPSGVRLHGDLVPPSPVTLPAPPRKTCRQRLFPPPQGDTIRGQTGAMAIFGNVHFRDDLYTDDFTAGWPETLPLAHAMLFAHEMVHVWQWQNRALTGYHPLRAAFEHVRTPDPYLFDPDTSARFLDYGYEQQGAIMEEYVCCRALAPEAARTARLHAMLSEVFTPPPLDQRLATNILIPWRGADIGDICD